MIVVTLCKDRKSKLGYWYLKYDRCFTRVTLQYLLAIAVAVLSSRDKAGSTSAPEIGTASSSVT